jgi:hypothetical protein
VTRIQQTPNRTVWRSKAATRALQRLAFTTRKKALGNLRPAGIAETVIMKIGGWRTRGVFEHYAIVSRGDMVDAMQKLQRAEQESTASHVIGHVESTDSSSNPATRVNYSPPVCCIINW